MQDLFVTRYCPPDESRGTIVVCRPLFEERKASARVLAEAARAFAASGYRVVWFDYRGCGDSPGCLADFTPHDWMPDGDRILAAERREDGRALIVLGLRYGAALALRLAVQHGADAAIVWEPVADGRAYVASELRKKLVKEMITFGRGRTRREVLVNRLETGQTIDFDGYQVTGELYREMCAFDPLATDTGFEGRILIASVSATRHESPAAVRLGEELRERGFSTEQCHVRGQPFWNQVGLVDGNDLIRATLDWLGEAPVRERPVTVTAESAEGSRETSISFEVEGQTVRGVLHAPEGGASPGGPAVVFLHGWSGCRLGPHRMFVTGARRLCARGWTCLRFDFRGRGDSDGASTQTTIAGMTRDAQAAVSILRAQFACGRVVLLGICSGCKVAVAAAAAGAVVDGLVLWSAEPMGDMASGDRRARKSIHALGEYTRKLCRADTWRKILTFGVNARMVRKAVLAEETADLVERREENSVLQRFRGFRKPAFFLYGGNDPETVLAAARYLDFCRQSGLDSEFHEVAGANHSFYSLEWEQEVLQRTEDWLAARWQ